MQPIQSGSPHARSARPRPRRGSISRSFPSHATRVELCIFDADSGAEIARYDLPGRTGDVWHGLLSPRRASAGHSLRVPCARTERSRERRGASIPRSLLLDPYARELCRPSEPLRSLVIEPAFDWQDDRPPATPWRDTVIYELHVKGYTQLHPRCSPSMARQVPRARDGAGHRPPQVHRRDGGRAAALSGVRDRGFPARARARELLGLQPDRLVRPCERVRREGRRARVQDHGAGAASRGRSRSFWTWSSTTPPKAARPGRCLASRASTMRRITGCMPDKRGYENLTGCGNTVNCEHPAVRALIIDCLRYWVEEMHVDGFRFDLATVLGRDASGFNESSPFFNGAARRARARLREADRRALGRRARRLSTRPISRRLVRVERPLPRYGAGLLAPRRRTHRRVRGAVRRIERYFPAQRPQAHARASIS